MLIIPFCFVITLVAALLNYFMSGLDTLFKLIFPFWPEITVVTVIKLLHVLSQYVVWADFSVSPCYHIGHNYNELLHVWTHSQNEEKQVNKLTDNSERNLMKLNKSKTKVIPFNFTKTWDFILTVKNKESSEVLEVPQGCHSTSSGNRCICKSGPISVLIGTNCAI